MRLFRRQASRLAYCKTLGSGFAAHAVEATGNGVWNIYILGLGKDGGGGTGAPF